MVVFFKLFLSFINFRSKSPTNLQRTLFVIFMVTFLFTYAVLQIFIIFLHFNLFPVPLTEDGTHRLKT